MATKQQSPWVVPLAIGLGIGIGLTVGREIGGESFWVRLPVGAAAAGVSALLIFAMVALVRWLQERERGGGRK